MSTSEVKPHSLLSLNNSYSVVLFHECQSSIPKRIYGISNNAVLSLENWYPDHNNILSND